MAEFLVNTLTDYTQDGPEVAVLADGSFVIVWASSYVNSDADVDVDYIGAQRYSATGARIGGETILSNLSYEASRPSISALKDGGYAVSWEAEGEETEIHTIAMDANGTKRGPERVVSVPANAEDDAFEVPQTASLANGGQLSMYVSDGGGLYSDVFARVVNAQGVPVGAQFRINATTRDDQAGVQSAELSNGNIAVVWDSKDTTLNSVGNEVDDVRGRILGANGRPVGPEFVISRENDGMTNWLGATYPISHLGVEGLNGGRFVVSWYETWLDAQANGDTAYVYRAQIFEGNGRAAGAAFTVNSSVDDIPEHGAITRTADGGFLVVWGASAPGGDPFEDVFGQFFTAAGRRVGGEFGIATNVRSGQERPTVETLADGRIVVAWESEDVHSDGTDIAATILDPGTLAGISRAGGAGADWLTGTALADRLRGNGGDDGIVGGHGNDSLFGSAGNDTLNGDAGNDMLMGESGNDLLRGGAGRDRIVGGTGNDALFGGSGADVFVFQTGSGRDRIADFQPGADRIDVSGIARFEDFADLRQNHMTRVGADVVIDFGTAAFRVADVMPRDLGPDAFLF